MPHNVLRCYATAEHRGRVRTTDRPAVPAVLRHVGGPPLEGVADALRVRRGLPVEADGAVGHEVDRVGLPREVHGRLNAVHDADRAPLPSGPLLAHFSLPTVAFSASRFATHASSPGNALSGRAPVFTS